MGLCYFMYRMLDELDGKQARKTGNSSALGMLFDHGCDSFSVGLMMMICAKMFGFGDNLLAMLFVTGPCALFHFTTIEEYYTGGLFLGRINPITDLSIIVISMFVYMGISGDTHFF